MDTPTLDIPIIDPQSINLVKLHRLAMIQNALDDGWKIEKRGTSYIFSKHHNQQREIFEEDYLNKFLSNKLNLSGICKS